MAEWPVQQVGSHGVDVRTVQYLLGEHGHPTVVDGVFGPATQGAVLAFQEATGLTADGLVGDQTWEALIVPVQAASNGEAVGAAQAQLRSQGWRLAVDGAFGPQTDRRVRDFQTARQLVADGVVGPLTWKFLVAGFRHVPSPEDAVAHLFDAWAANDRRAASTNATPAAVDMLLRGDHGGGLADAGCGPYPQLGPDDFLCSKFYEGGGINLHVRGNATDGFYVESVSFVID